MVHAHVILVILDEPFIGAFVSVALDTNAVRIGPQVLAVDAFEEPLPPNLRTHFVRPLDEQRLAVEVPPQVRVAPSQKPLLGRATGFVHHHVIFVFVAEDPFGPGPVGVG